MLNLKRDTVNNPEDYPQEKVPSIQEKHMQNKELCARCGGRCCKNAPCHYSPTDFEDLSYSGLKRIIDERGYISIVKIGMIDYDYYKELSDQYSYYILRIKRHGDRNAFRIEQKTIPRMCMLWTKDGCKLNFDERPLGAKMLIPIKHFKCEQKYSFEKCMLDWKPYTKTLKALYRYYRRKRFFDFIKNKVYKKN